MGRHRNNNSAQNQKVFSLQVKNVGTAGTTSASSTSTNTSTNSTTNTNTNTSIYSTTNTNSTNTNKETTDTSTLHTVTGTAAISPPPNSVTDEMDVQYDAATVRSFFLLEALSYADEPKDHRPPDDNETIQDLLHSPGDGNHHTIGIILRYFRWYHFFLLCFLLGWTLGSGIFTGNFAQVQLAFRKKILSKWSPINTLHHSNVQALNVQDKSEHPTWSNKKIPVRQKELIAWRQRLANQIRHTAMYTALRSFPRFSMHRDTLARLRRRFHTFYKRSNITYRLAILFLPWADWSRWDAVDSTYDDYETPLSSSRYASTYSYTYTLGTTILNALFGYTPRVTAARTRSWKKIRDGGASHPLSFALLREMVRREQGYVHPDLGLLLPAPSGAARGLGMVRHSFTMCQRRCMPGIATEKMHYATRGATSSTHTHQRRQEVEEDETNRHMNPNDVGPPYSNSTSVLLLSPIHIDAILQAQQSIRPIFHQEEVLLKIPLRVQMTRTVALHVLTPLIPMDILTKAPLLELDDAMLLVLLLAHEKMKGKTSIYWPYIRTLPMQPSCAFTNSPALNAIAAASGGDPRMTPHENIWIMLKTMGTTLGMDVHGWFEHAIKAGDYAESISETLARNYGAYIYVQSSASSIGQNYNELFNSKTRDFGKKSHPYSSADVQTAVGKSFAFIQWALCHVSSRAIAASDKHGALRLVPMLDMINHSVDYGGFIELDGNERLENGDIVDAAEEEDSGMFVIRSMRNGRRKPLKKGQELLANYNIPFYSPLDWFINLGFVPEERREKWELLEPGLPRVQQYYRDRMGSSKASSNQSLHPHEDGHITIDAASLEAKFSF